ncbi:sensor histidine kinase [Pseudonocardia sp. N23]|uniref:sensor histidine kinase n=1 Tax=Pseudonocardia sp. N23 TaxID=1987376 RepID=UPI000BFB22EC|nr:histidine kinase [Pseudonocardia sp. N23]GAY11817.1 putative two component system sensor kinase [Pseudonocardia sp. N23]
MILDPRPGPVRRITTVVWLPIILGGAVIGPPRIGLSALSVTGSLLVILGWSVMAIRPARPPGLHPAGIVAVAAGGALLVADIGRWSIPIAFCYVAVGAAGGRMPLRLALPVFGATGVGLAVAMWQQESLLSIGVVVLSLVSVLLIGTAQRSARRRAEEREQALASEARADEEHTRAAALAERARIARDVHDVLAHSLSALAVQLQGAKLMVQRDGSPPDTVQQIERAHRLAVEGLTEARRAVHALRTEPVDLREGLAALVDEHPHATLDADDVGLLPPEVRETVLRTAQEALTNARKHAPEAPVRVRLAHDPGATVLDVRDLAGAPPPPATPGGYGLVGMGERAALIGAHLDAGPTEDGWRVTLTVPRT